MATRKRTFTPSYRTATLVEYEARLSDVGRGVKRSDHIMLSGGRAAMRHPKFQYPKDPSKGGPSATAEDVGVEGESISEATLLRLSKLREYVDKHPQERPWVTRTQASGAGGGSGASGDRAAGLEAQIAAAIDLYRKRSGSLGKEGFLVPDSAGPLIDAGMPKKPAYILVERVGRAFFPDSPPVGIQRYRSILDAVSATTGSKLELKTLEIKSERRGSEVVLSRNRELGHLLSVFIASDDTDDAEFNEPVLSPERLELADQTWHSYVKTVEKRKYREIDDNLRFMQLVFGAPEDSDIKPSLPRLTATARRLGKEWGVTSVSVRLRFSSKQTIKVPFSVGEHSISSADKAKTPRFEYKSLGRGSIGLRALPDLLARLSRRKKRTGRRLPRETASALENPKMYDDDNDFFLEMYAKRPYGAQQSLPAARRNPAAGQAKAAMDLYHSGRASSLKEAWRIVKGGGRARVSVPKPKSKPVRVRKAAKAAKARAPKAPRASRKTKTARVRRAFDVQAVSPTKAFGAPSLPQAYRIGRYLHLTTKADAERILSWFNTYSEAHNAIDQLEQAKARSGGNLSEEQAVEIVRDCLANKGTFSNPRRRRY